MKQHILLPIFNNCRHILTLYVFLTESLKPDRIVKISELTKPDLVHLHSWPVESFSFSFILCRMLECRYLQFESEVTQDILSRGILSEPALGLLFRVHIDKHKHQLREVSTKLCVFPPRMPPT